MDSNLKEKLIGIKGLMERAGTVSEAEAAAAAMTRLVLKHNISEEELASLGVVDKEAYESGYIQVGPNGSSGLQWKLNLLYVLSEFNFCKFVRAGKHGGDGYIIGQPTNQKIVIEMFNVTVQTVERLAVDEWYIMLNDWERMMNAGNPKASGWKNSFKLGFPSGLHLKLMMQKAELEKDDTTSALMVVKDGELDKAVEEKVGKLQKSRGSNPTNRDGYYRGVERGMRHGLVEQIEYS